MNFATLTQLLNRVETTNLIMTLTLQHWHSAESNQHWTDLSLMTTLLPFEELLIAEFN